jgi:general secretion pathway protein A
MYESFYGFREKPFSLLPDPDFLYLGGRYRTAWGLLEYGLLNQAGFIVITGETGTGKTTLLRKLLAEAQEECAVGILAFTQSGWNSLMPWILRVFNLPWKGKDAIEQFEAFSEFLMEQAVQGRRAVLIVDEAQGLTPAMLEELRLLSNINADKVPLLQIVLSGQPRLHELLQRPDLRQFAQRVAVDYTLEAMDEKDTAEYIRHRIMVAGGQPDLFSPQACVAAHRVTGGLPRLVNQVCDLALTYGYAEQARQITVRLVADVARDRTMGCILPLAVHVDLSDLKEEAAPSAAPAQPVAAAPPPRVERPEPRPAPPPQEILPVEEPGRGRAPITVEEWLKRGQHLRRKGRYKDALRALAEATHDPATSFKAYAEAGFCYREAGRMTEAIEAFRKAFGDRTAPRDERVAVCYELGRALETARKPAEALDCYRRVSRVDPEFQDVAQRIERLGGEASSASGREVGSEPLRPEQRNGSWLGGFLGGLRRLLRMERNAAAARSGRRR